MVNRVYRFRDRLANNGQRTKMIPSIKEKEIVAEMNCLETSIYSVLRLLDKKFDCSMQSTLTLLVWPI